MTALSQKSLEHKAEILWKNVKLIHPSIKNWDRNKIEDLEIVKM